LQSASTQTCATINSGIDPTCVVLISRLKHVLLKSDSLSEPVVRKTGHDFSMNTPVCHFGAPHKPVLHLEDLWPSCWTKNPSFGTCCTKPEIS